MRLLIPFFCLVRLLPRAAAAGLLFGGLALAATVARAEVVRDGTIGPGAGIQPAGPDYVIGQGMGETRGVNLFHSFLHFSLLSSESANFAGDAMIQNVISRVTGGSVSSLDGLLSSEIPNVYLINPAGVIFGRNARLELAGSFHASTADYLVLGEGGGRFDATNLGETVLAVAPPTAFGFLGPPAPIEVQGSLLEVTPGATLSLVGGDLSIAAESHPESALFENSTLVAPGGELLLASVASAGEVVPDSASDPLDVSGFSALGQIQVTGPGFYNAAFNVEGEPSGRVVIRGGQLTLEAGASILATTAGPDDHPGTAVDIGLSGDMRMDRSEIGASTRGLGRAGDVLIIIGGRLEMIGDPVTPFFTNIGSRSFGFEEGGMMVGGGNGGVVLIEASDLVMGDGTFIQTTTFSPGRAGDIILRLSGSLEMVTEDSFSFISSSSAGPIAALIDPSIDPEAFNPAGSGDAGTLRIEADKVFLKEGPGAFFTGLAVQVRSDAVGNPDGGSLEIDARSVEVLDGAQINGAIFKGAGSGGAITINADSILLRGVALNEDGSVLFVGDFFPAGIFSTVGTTFSTFGGTTARGGDVVITARDLTIADGAQIRNAADFPSSGNAGNTFLEVQNLTLRNSGGVYTDSFGFGDGGRMVVRADQILIEGPSVAPSFSGTGLFARGGTGARSSGEIDVQTGTLVILAGGQINTSTSGMAQGGMTLVEADEIIISGTDTAEDDPAFPSGPQGTPSQISSDSSIFGPFVAFSGGDGGNVTIRAGDLTVEDLGIVAARTITTGRGGNLDIFTNTTTVRNGGEITVVSSAEGDAGDIRIETLNLEVQDAAITAEADSADGGNIDVAAGNMLLVDGGQITATVGGGVGDGGNVTLEGGFVILRNGEITANAFGGRGGNILITTPVFLADPGTTLSASSELGIAGTVQVNSPETDIEGAVIAPEASYLDAAALMNERCAAQRTAELSSFVVMGNDGLASGPDALLSSPGGAALPGTTPLLARSAPLPRAIGSAPPALLISCGSE